MDSERRLLITWAMSNDAERPIYFYEFDELGETDVNYVEIVRQMSAATKHHLRAGEHMEVEDGPWYPTEHLNAQRWTAPQAM